MDRDSDERNQLHRREYTMSECTWINLEVGKVYRTVDGTKVTIIAKINSPLPYVGIFPFGEGEGVRQWHADGKYTVDGSTPSSKDIISEWREPKRVSGWVNVYHTSGSTHLGGIYDTESAARAAGIGNHQYINTTYIEVEEDMK